MTEVYQGPFDPLYGDRPPRVVAPKDPYHEPYPGAWDRKLDRAPTVKLQEATSKTEQPRGRERLNPPQVGCQ